MWTAWAAWTVWSVWSVLGGPVVVVVVDVEGHAGRGAQTAVQRPPVLHRVDASVTRPPHNDGDDQEEDAGGDEAEEAWSRDRQVLHIV